MQHDPKLRLALALQGGGSYGAYTWGVLDRLLEAGVALTAASGTSAGAVNAVLLADGLAAGGPEEARARLGRFWRLLSDRAGPAMLAGFMPTGTPFAFKLPGADPMRDLLEELVDFERLRQAPPLKLLIAATRVRDGTARIFREAEVTLDTVLASACLPLLREAVVIDGEAYWDGGYSANPPLRDLIETVPTRDVLLVELSPHERDGAPWLRQDIRMRSLELAFAAPLQREIAALDDMREMCRRTRLLRPAPCRRLEALRLHRLSVWDGEEDLTFTNPANLSWHFLSRLAEAGRKAGGDWLATRTRSAAAD